MRSAPALLRPKKILRFERANHKKELVFKILVIILLLFVLVGTLSPFIIKGVLIVQNSFNNVLTNITQKKTPLTPVTASFEQQVVAKLDKSIFEPKSFNREEGFLEVTSSQGVVALFSPTGELDTQVSSLQTLLVKSRIEAKPIKKVDLRFNKLFVEY